MRKKIVVSPDIKCIYENSGEENVLTAYIELIFRYRNRKFLRDAKSIGIEDNRMFMSTYIILEDDLNEVNRVLHRRDKTDNRVEYHSLTELLRLGYLRGAVNMEEIMYRKATGKTTLGLRQVSPKCKFNVTLHNNYYEAHSSIMDSTELEVWLRLYLSTCVGSIYKFTKSKFIDEFVKYRKDIEVDSCRKKAERCIKKLIDNKLLYVVAKNTYSNTDNIEALESWYGVDSYNKLWVDEVENTLVRLKDRLNLASNVADMSVELIERLKMTDNHEETLRIIDEYTSDNDLLMYMSYLNEATRSVELLRYETDEAKNKSAEIIKNLKESN